MNFYAKILDNAKELEKRNYKEVVLRINYIIDNNIKDISIIEHTLDLLLSFSFVDVDDEFNRLNDYYESVNQEYSNEYKLIYKEHKDRDE